MYYCIYLWIASNFRRTGIRLLLAGFESTRMPRLALLCRSNTAIPEAYALGVFAKYSSVYTNY